jgi:hypothetical protein
MQDTFIYGCAGSELGHEVVRRVIALMSREYILWLTDVVKDRRGAVCHNKLEPLTRLELERTDNRNKSCRVLPPITFHDNEEQEWQELLSSYPSLRDTHLWALVIFSRMGLNGDLEKEVKTLLSYLKPAIWSTTKIIVVTDRAIVSGTQFSFGRTAKLFYRKYNCDDMSLLGDILNAMGIAYGTVS